MKRTALFLLCGMAITLAGCVAAGPRLSPPPPRAEVRAVRPGPNHVWIKGHWIWKGNRYVWSTGRWIKARPGYAWAPGHWDRRGHRWVYIKGRWIRR